MILEFKDVEYSYESKYRTAKVLFGVSCGFEAGRSYAVVGKSGSGKSTALMLMAGLDLPKGGQVLYDGKPTSAFDLDRYRRECVCVIYQNFRLFPLLTALENVMYPMELRGVKTGEAMQRAKELILSVGLPEEVFDSFPGMISGGEQQRVAIARALASEARVILADEPTGNLDSENSANVIDILTRLAHEKNYCVIIVTHDLDVVGKMDKVIRIKDGRMYPQD